MAHHSPSIIMYVMNPPPPSFWNLKWLKTLWKNTNTYFIEKSKFVNTMTLESPHMLLERPPERLTCLPAAQTLRSTAHARRTQGLHCHGADELKLPG